MYKYKKISISKMQLLSHRGLNHEPCVITS
jgi:hypothetical protein